MKNLKFNKIALIGRYKDNFSKNKILEIIDFLYKLNCQIILEEETAINNKINKIETIKRIENIENLGNICEIAIVIGGDGTMLNTARYLANYKTPLIGINQGRLGFITDIALNDYQNDLIEILNGNYQEENRSLIKAKIIRKEGQIKRKIFESLAINDIVINRGGNSGMLEIKIEVNNNFVSNQRVDGLIIATPTGSTAYSLSVGGPMIQPDTKAWVIAPIAPHNLSNRPLVLSDKSQIIVEITEQREESSVNFDMQSFTKLQTNDQIQISKSSKNIKLLHPKNWNYFSTLRKKLGWNG